MNLRRIRVVAALVRKGDSVLVQQRRPDEARALLWEFPGGKIEPAETPEAALERECREEMGIEVVAGRRVDTVVHTYADLEVELGLYECLLKAGEPRAIHAHDVRWVPVAGLHELPFCEADEPFLRALERGDY